MLKEKKSDTDAEKQKVVLMRLISELSHKNPDLYYQPTNQIARVLEERIKKGVQMDATEIELMKKLDNRDIQILLSLQ